MCAPTSDRMSTGQDESAASAQDLRLASPQEEGSTHGFAELARTQRTSQQTTTVPVREHLRTLEDGDVVSSFLAGEERAFEELVDRYQGRLLNFVYRTIGDRDRAEDLVQEVFIRVYRHIARFDRSKKFSTWIYTIASNLAKNELRNRSRNPLVLFQTIKAKFEDEDRPLQFEDVHTRPDDLFRKRHLREMVEQSVGKLPAHHREVFVLRELRGQVVRRNRRDHRREPRYREVAPQPGAHGLRRDHSPYGSVRRLISRVSRGSWKDIDQ